MKTEDILRLVIGTFVLDILLVAYLVSQIP